MSTPLNQLKSQQKRLLRKSIGTALGQIVKGSIEAQSNEIARRIQALPEFKAAKGICCYLSMPSGEVSTASITASILRESGKKLLVPRILDKKESVMDCFEIYGEDDLASLPSGTWGIKEPDLLWNGKPRTNALQEGSETLDLILMPAVAYDRSFSRLGHGKGYYDRFIAKYTSTGRRKPFLVGLSLREQLLEGGVVPVTELDWKMDAIVTPDEVLREGERVGGASSDSPSV